MSTAPPSRLRRYALAAAALAAAFAGGTQVPPLRPAATPVSAPAAPAVFDVTGFGADRTGKLDSTVAIRKAQAAAEAVGGTITFPAGTYAVCPQPGDPVAAQFAPAIFTIRAPARWQFNGSILNTKMAGLKSPAATWTTTGDSYSKIARYSLFSVLAGCNGSLSFDSGTFQGGTAWTGNYTVGGVVATGDGWDMSHKCFRLDGPAAIGAVTITNCRLIGWRGEGVYAGGTAVRSIALSGCLVDESNADAVSASAPVTITNCTLGPSVYQAVENQAVRDGQYLTVVGSNLTGQGGQAVSRLESAGVTGAPLSVTNCTLTGYRGILFATAAHGVTVTGSVFNSQVQAAILSGGNCADGLFDRCTFGGTAGVWFQGQTWTGLAFRRCVCARGPLYGGQVGAGSTITAE